MTGGPRAMQPGGFRLRAAPAALAALSAAAVLVSAVTPMLLAQLDGATLREQVAAAGPSRDALVVQAAVGPDGDLPAAEAAAGDAVRAGTVGSDRWGPLAQVLEASRGARVSEGAGATGVLLSFAIAPTDCAGLRIVRGTCPHQSYDVAVAASTSASRGWRPGQDLDATIPGHIGTETLRIVGLYDDRAGLGTALADPSSLRTGRVSRSVPDLVVDEASADAIGGGVALTAARRIARPVRPADVPALLAGVRAATAASRTDAGAAASVVVSSGVPALLEDVARLQTAAAALLAPVGLSALVLAWAALFLVARRLARARAAEWGIDRVRGVLVRRWLLRVFAGPVAAVLAGALLGWLGAVLIAGVAERALLGADRPSVLDVPPAAPIAAAAAVAGSLLGLVAAVLRAALLPLDALLQDQLEPRRPGRAALAGRVALLTVAAATGVALGVAPASGAVLLLPVLLAAVVGLAVRGAAVTGARGALRRPPRGLAGLVVVRGTARAPSALAAAQLLLVAVALAAWVVQAQAESAAVQTGRAELAVGAPQVLVVTAPRSGSLLQAVRAADPGGRTALAAAQIGQDGEQGAQHVVAVDTRRLDAIGLWRASWRGDVDLARLRVPAGRDLTLRGARLSIEIDALRRGEVLDLPALSPLRLSAVVATTDGWTTVQLGRLRDGVLRADVPCTAGCRLVALGVRKESGEDGGWGARFLISGIATDRQPTSAFRSWLSGPRWRDRVVDALDPRRPARVALRSGTAGLAVAVADREGDLTASFEPAVGPAVLPVALATGSATTPFPGVPHAVEGSGLSTGDVLMRPVGSATALPRVLRRGALVDLAAAERETDPASALAELQVWTTAGDHPRLLAALQRQGVRVLGREVAASAVGGALDAATNRALVLAGATAVAAVLLALLALVAAGVLDGPSRRREQHVLRLTGVPERRVLALAATRASVPAAVAVLLGIACGASAAALSTDSLPLLVGVSPGPPVDASPAAGLPVLAALLLVLVVAVGVGGAALDRRAVRP